MAASRPRRLVIINDRSAMVGGASNLAILSARLMRERGIEVSFFAGDSLSDDRPVPDTVCLGAKPITQQGKLAALGNGLYNADAYRTLRDLMARVEGPGTIYHVHGWSKILSPSVFRALAPVRHRVVLHAHDYFLACPNGGFANYRTHEVCPLKPMSVECLTTQCDKRGYHEKVWRSLRHEMRRRYFPTEALPANLVFVHEGMNGYFSRSGLDVSRAVTIRNPIEPFLAVPGEPWTRRALFFIGRLEPEKGYSDAAAAARMAGAELQVIGDGAGRAVLARGYPEILQHGWKTRDGIAALVGNARAVVVSSRVPEPFALAAVEAVASGIPVIVPNQALIGREIADLGCGLTFETGNIASLAQAMTAIASDDGLVRGMSGNCLREAPAMANTPERWGDALWSLYENILDRNERLPLAG